MKIILLVIFFLIVGFLVYSLTDSKFNTQEYLLEECNSIDKTLYSDALYAKYSFEFISECRSIDKMSCEQQNGKWFAPDVYGSCLLPTTDLGTECSDSSQCEGYCEAKPEAVPGTDDTGICSSFTNDICFTPVRNGTVQVTSCYWII